MKELALTLIAFLLCQSPALAQNGACISNTSISLEIEEASSNLPSIVGHMPAALTTSGWCVQEILSLPYIELKFEDPILLHNVEIAAVNGSLVTAVQLQILVTEAGNYQYIINENTRLPMVFEIQNKTNSSTLEIDLLGKVIFALSLRIIPYSWTRYPLCMKMELEGCYTDNIPPSDEPVSREVICLQSVLPVAALIILIIAVANIIICCACMNKKKKRMTMKPRMTSDIDSTIKHVRNDLYSPAQGRSRTRTSDSTMYIIPGSPQPYEIAQSPGDKSGTSNTNVSTISSAGYTKIRSRVNTYDIVAAEIEPDNQLTDTEEATMYLNVPEPQTTEASFSTEAARSGNEVTRKSEYFDREQLEKELGLTVTESYGPEHFRV